MTETDLQRLREHIREQTVKEIKEGLKEKVFKKLEEQKEINTKFSEELSDIKNSIRSLASGLRIALHNVKITKEFDKELLQIAKDGKKKWIE